MSVSRPPLYFYHQPVHCGPSIPPTPSSTTMSFRVHATSSRNLGGAGVSVSRPRLGFTTNPSIAAPLSHQPARPEALCSFWPRRLFQRLIVPR